MTVHRYGESDNGVNLWVAVLVKLPLPVGRVTMSVVSL